jgi:hypothetical protein
VDVSHRLVLGEADQKERPLCTLMEMRDYEHKRSGLVSLSRRIDI